MTNESIPQNETLEHRLHHVEAALGLKAPAFEDRLEAIETKVEELTSDPGPEPWLTALDYLIKIVSGLTPIAVLVVGFMIQGSVELAIQQQELNIKQARLKLDEAQALDSLLRDFRKPNIGEQEARRLALMILDYGNAGIRPLVQDLDVEPAKQVRGDAAAHALKMYAVISDDRATVCPLLGRIDAMQPSVFGPDGLQRISKLRQALDCGTFD